MELYVSIGKQIKKGRTRKCISLDTLSDLIGGIKTKSTCDNAIICIYIFLQHHSSSQV